ESGFKIERCSGSLATCVLPTSFVVIGQAAANATAFSDTSVTGGNTYTYQVRAFNGGGDSAPSNPAEATTPAPHPPAAPCNLTATAGSTGNTTWIDLAWTDNSNNETNFAIERCTGINCTNFAALATVAANTTTYRDSTTARRTTYRYRVKAHNAVGDSAYSNVATAQTK